MKTRANKRMNKVGKAIAVLPIRPRVLQKAFDHFSQVGELPEDQRLADAVARKVLGLEHQDADGNTGIAGLIAQTQAAVQVVTKARPHEEERPTVPSVREVLLDEAVFGSDYVRRVARAALALEVDKGCDPTDPQFLTDRKMPRYGTVGLKLFGYPERLAKRPYVKQAHRLFVRYSAILDEVDHEDPDWLDDMAVALVQLEHTGRLPWDDELRDSLLCHVELDALFDHARGQDVRQLMAALNRATTKTGKAREAALHRVGSLMSARSKTE